MLKLHQSTIFKQEYEFFRDKINKIENIQLKEELNALLNVLLIEVKNVDTLHNELSITNRLPIGANDSKHKINTIRKQLITKLRDWDESIKQTELS